MRTYTENALIQQYAIEQFARLGYEIVDASYEQPGKCTTTGRQRDSEVVLVPRLRAALQRLNQETPPELIDKAIDELTRDRSILSLVRANEEIYRLLKDGVKIDTRGESSPGDHSQDNEAQKTIRIIDWGDVPEQNDFLLVSHFCVSGKMGRKCIDLLGFVNGLPLIVMELQASRLKELYEQRISDYKQNIPQLFWYNALIILSNGDESKLGSLTTPWEHFFEWKRIRDEKEPESTTLETMVQGTCEKNRFLDIVENFTLFSSDGGGLKLIARNHQFLGVNNVFDALRNTGENRGKLGVFWHTQGSGKSYSMIFFSQKVLRKVPGDWTFVVVTDREDLDKQIYGNFQKVGAVIEPEKDVHAKNGRHLQRLLRENHRTVFTLIQKFRTEKPGQVYKKLSDRSDIIVVTDEAHRTQYDILARNMRDALPKASFIGFTGTPLVEGEKETRETFGDYISIYNFRQSIKDKITVPLYYENRTPEVELTNLDFNVEIEQLLDEAMLSDEQEQELSSQFPKEYHVLVQDNRLDRVAEDIVEHFMNRGYMGKAMVVSVDKLTTVRMYYKVQKYWRRYLDNLQTQLLAESQVEMRAELEDKIAYMQTTDMAVVISEAKGEVEKFAKYRLNIRPHRRRIQEGRLEEQFKDPEHPLRIVFVCAMWMTGFDVPCLSTVYLDRPMRNHTLMQTIARANRVFEDKTNGLIVDYVGTFHDLQHALAIYASTDDNRTEDMPVGDKSELVRVLQEALAEIETFCQEQGIDIQALLTVQEPQQVKEQLRAAVDALVANDETKLQYLILAGDVRRLYKAILPDTAASDYTQQVNLFQKLEHETYSLMRSPSVSEVIADVTRLMDDAITTRDYVVRESEGPYDVRGQIDLSKIDVSGLIANFNAGYKHIKAERLRGLLSEKLKQMISVNKSRIDYQQKLQRIIDDYNEGSANIDIYYYDLIDEVKELSIEDQRHIAEQLTEEELAIFDLLTRPDMKLSEDEKKQVKKVARDLLETLKREKLVLDWHKKRDTQAQVEETIMQILNLLPAVYTKDVYDQKCVEVYNHIYTSYRREGNMPAA